MDSPGITNPAKHANKVRQQMDATPDNVALLCVDIRATKNVAAANNPAFPDDVIAFTRSGDDDDNRGFDALVLAIALLVRCPAVTRS